MQFYSFQNGLQPLGEQPPEKWEHLLAVLEPAELAEAKLPETFAPPAAREGAHESQMCVLRADRNGVSGHIHVPPRGNQAARRFSFTWSQGSVLIVDHDRAAGRCIDVILAGREHDIGGADRFFADLLLTLIRDDLPGLEQIETRLANLEREVLEDRTASFIHRMSVIRRELSRENRFYMQLADFGSSLLEEAEDLFDRRSVRRMNCFLRRVDVLRGEAELLREYAMQISGEYQSQVDIAQNRVMQLLTIVTTIFLPLSLIAGWYGMNFNMPELRWSGGYPAVVLLAVVIVAALIVFFKRKKWF